MISSYFISLMQLKSLNDNKNVCFPRLICQEGSNKYMHIQIYQLYKVEHVGNDAVATKQEVSLFCINTVTDAAHYSLFINASNFSSVLFIQHQ